MSAPSSSSTLQAQSAAWIVEDYSSGGLVPFANFGTVTFTDCNAEAAVDFSGGQDVPLTSEVGTEADIVANGAVITAVTFDDSSNSLQVTYV